MNKQELIEKYEYLNHDYFRRVDTSEVLRDLKQLDEPQKVVVPQFVADWYEEHQDNFDYTLWEYLVDWDRQNPSDFKEWIAEGDKYDPLITLVNMHQFGYEVEKEKRYLVKVKGVNEYGCYLNKGLLSKEYFLESKAEIGGCRTKHTRKQLEDDDFGWVFDCPGIEIEEVEG